MSKKEKKFRKFLAKAVKKHGDGTYGYDAVNYISSTVKVSIYCPRHDSYFQQTPGVHLYGGGCPECGIECRTLTREQFIRRATDLHGEHKYSYEAVVYQHSNIKVSIYCNKCQVYFYQRPSAHLSGNGCYTCGRNDTKLTKEDFIEKSISMHPSGVYSYHLVNYTHSHSKVDIYCNIHQKTFSMRPFAHLRGQGCPDCGKEKNASNRTITQEEYVSRCLEKHQGVYGYDRTVYKGSSEKVEIYCKYHNEYFFQWPSNHLKGAGCVKCAHEKSKRDQIWSNEEYIEKAIEAHGDDYGYDQVNYTGAFNKIDIFCKIHQEYFSQVAHRHLQGHGCPTCRESTGEKNVRKCLSSLGITYIREYRMPQEKRFLYDFFLPDYNVYIEFHGEQHFNYTKFFHKSKKEYELRKLHDKIKRQLIEVWGGELIVIHFKFNTEEKVMELLLNEFGRLNLNVDQLKEG